MDEREQVALGVFVAELLDDLVRQPVQRPERHEFDLVAQLRGRRTGAIGSGSM